MSQSFQIDITNTVLIFLTLHLLIYPASNAYNSFMDKDKGSIGVLKNPPPVDQKVYYTSIVLDLTGLVLMLLINLKMAMLVLIYIAVSKAYSWSGIRLKKFPIIGWLTVILFQGGYTFLLVSMAAENNLSFGWFTPIKIEGMIFSSLLIGAYYPLTQIYQHSEDSSRGDITISYKLGIRGTFIFSAIMFLISFAVAFHFYETYFSLNQFYIFIICLLPAIVFFFNWFIKTLLKKAEADFEHTMTMTWISSTCLIMGFGILFFLNH